MNKIALSSLIAVSLISILVSIPATCSAARPTIISAWTSSPPTIDGIFTPGEWFNPQIIMREPDYPIDANAYFLNDNSNLYILVDAIEDTIQNVEDECLLIFNFNSQIIVRLEGTSDSLSKSSDSFNAAIGFDSSPNSANNHKIYEFSIPFSFLNIEPGSSIDLCSPFWKSQGSIPYDPDGGSNNDNIWPPEIGFSSEWQTNLGLWGILSTRTSRVVGGSLMPVNKLGILTPYLAYASILVAIGIVVLWKKSKN